MEQTTLATTNTETTEATTPVPTPALAAGSDAEKRWLLAAAIAIDSFFVEWVAAGRDPEELASELRITVTQSALAMSRVAEDRERTKTGGQP